MAEAREEKSMQGIAKTEDQTGVELVDWAIPEPVDDDVLIKVTVAGICGSDLNLYRWRETERAQLSAGKMTLPFIIGHEFCGIVESIGPQVRHLRPGDRVAGETHVPCMNCYVCQTGNPHICPHMQLIGRQVTGSLAEYTKVPEIGLYQVPSTLNDHEVALLEPLGVAVNAVEKAHVSGDTVLITGCGPIGLMSIAVAKAMGASMVVATSRTDTKLEKARAMGADAVFGADDPDCVDRIRETVEREGVGAVIDMSGSQEAINQGFACIRCAGRFVQVGTPAAPVTVEMVGSVMHKEVEIAGVFGRRMWNTWITAKDLLARESVRTDLIMGGDYRLNEYEKAFEEAFSGLAGRTFFTPQADC
jgi:threonine 3-dehydrogenase